MTVIKAILQAHPGKEKELEEMLRSIIPKVETEEGTLQYTLHQAQITPGRFLFYEKYRDQEALNTHMATPYLREVLEKCEGLLLQKPDVEFYNEIAGFNRTTG